MNCPARGWSGLVAGFVIFAGLACSSSGGSKGSGTVSTSVPAGTKLTSLTSSQAQQLCDDLDRSLQNTLTTALCKQLALESTVLFAAFSSSQPTDAELQMICAQAYNGCLHPDGGASTTTTSCDPTAFTSEPATCQATVGDVTACANDEATLYQQVSASIPDCSALTAAVVASYTGADAGTGPTVTEPASCTKFDSTCNTMSNSM